MLRFPGVNLNPLANLKTRTSPDYGNYLLSKSEPVSIPVFLQDLVYEFKLAKNSNIAEGDYSLTIELHDLNSSDLTTKVQSFPIWIFWYKPADEIIKAAKKYLNQNQHNYNLGILFYLEISPDISRLLAEEKRELEIKLNSELTAISNKILLYQIPNPLELQSFAALTKRLAKEIIKPLAEMVK